MKGCCKKERPFFFDIRQKCSWYTLSLTSQTLSDISRRGATVVEFFCIRKIEQVQTDFTKQEIGQKLHQFQFKSVTCITKNPIYMKGVAETVNQNFRLKLNNWLNLIQGREDELDPVGSTVRYEMMKLCTGLVIDGTGLVEGIYAFKYCTKWRSGQVLPMPH